MILVSQLSDCWPHIVCLFVVLFRYLFVHRLPILSVSRGGRNSECIFEHDIQSMRTLFVIIKLALSNWLSHWITKWLAIFLLNPSVPTEEAMETISVVDVVVVIVVVTFYGYCPRRIPISFFCFIVEQGLQATVDARSEWVGCFPSLLSWALLNPVSSTGRFTPGPTMHYPVIKGLGNIHCFSCCC